MTEGGQDEAGDFFFFFFLIDFLSWGDDAESTGTQKQLEYLRQKTQGRELLRERTPEI